MKLKTKKENRNLTKEIIAINRLLLKLNAALRLRLPGKSKCDQISHSINQTLYAHPHTVCVCGSQCVLGLCGG